MKRAKTAKQLERHFKGVANHHRLQILMLVAKNEGVSLDWIARELRSNLKTTGEHTRRLFHAGLLDKKYVGRAVAHELSPYGKQFVDFITTFSLS